VSVDARNEVGKLVRLEVKVVLRGCDVGKRLCSCMERERGG
jgi:hypothetical protein